MTNQKQLEVAKTLVAGLFKNTRGEPYVMTDGEAEMFLKIIDPSIKWLWLSAPTRYGKTEILAMAFIYLAVFHHLKLPVVGGSEDKATKIMEYIVQHLPDHPKLYQGLINVDFTHIERLKVTVSKDALRWYGGGWIFITSVDARNLSKEGEKVVGEGGDVVLLEEAGLIRRKDQFSKVVRMPEENRGWGKLIMSGNCVENSVFEQAFNDPMYHKVRVDLEQAIKEGRFSRQAIEQKKTQTTSKDWKRYYLVMFPAANEFTYFKPKKYDVLPRELSNYGAVDLALGENKKGSLVGIVVLGRDKNGQAYEVESIGLQLKPDETIRTIFNLPEKFERFVVEAVQFQKYFLSVIERQSKEKKLYIPFEGITQTKNKIERIESLEPMINTGQILFKGDNLLWEHLQDYPEAENLDVLDALEMAWRSMTAGDVDFSFV